MDTALTARLIRIGGDYERAERARDYVTLDRLSRELDELDTANPTVWLAPFVVRGRNCIRRQHGQEPLHV